MYQKPCGLSRADKCWMGGGGGDVSIDRRYWPNEQRQIGQGYGFQTDELNKFIAQSPLLSGAQTGALQYNQDLPALLAQFGGFGDQLSKYQKQIGGYQGQLGNIYSSIPGAFGGIEKQLSGLAGRYSGLADRFGEQAGTLGGWLARPSATIASGGALSSQAERDVAQRTRALGAAQGNVHTTGALGTELLNREAEQERRYNQALSQGQGLLAQQQGVYGAQGGAYGGQQSALGQLAQTRGQRLGLQSGITGQQAGLSSVGAGLTGQRAGLLGQQQALQTGGLNQLLGASGAGVTQFGATTNPILAYLGNMFQGNQQASIAQAQIGAQQQAASDAKGGSTAGGAMSAIGTIAPILMMAFSDERVKTKIKGTGLETVEGVPIKTWEYKTKPGVRYLSATAQDIEEKVPSAVFTEPLSGLKLVDSGQFPIIRVSALKAT